MVDIEVWTLNYAQVTCVWVANTTDFVFFSRMHHKFLVLSFSIISEWN
jgi:hypothetical protein